MSLYQPLSLINGQWVGASSGAIFDVINPATGEVVETVADLSAADCQTAIDAAEAAFPSWAALTAKERATILRRWFNLITEHTEALAALITEEMGFFRTYRDSFAWNNLAIILFEMDQRSI